MSTIHNYSNYYESEKATLYKLECLYQGYDPLKRSDKNEIIIDGGYDALQISNDELYQFIEELEAQDKLESKQLANLGNYTTTQLHGIRKIESVIDFIDIVFKPFKSYSSRESLKGALTKVSGTKYFIEELSNGMFSIRLHDIKNKKDLRKRLQPLSYFDKSINIDALQITCIERAIDFYFDDEPKAEFALALFKALRLPCNVQDVRIYRNKNESYRLNSNKAPHRHEEFIKLLADGWNIAINNERESDFYYHIYIKKTDTIDGALIDLPRDQWRIRLEIRVKEKGLLNLLGDELTTYKSVVTTNDLSAIILVMSKITKVTAIKTSTTNYVKSAFDDFPRLSGRERSTEFNKKRHTKPQLSKSFEPHKTMNILIKESQRNLSKKFK